MPKPPDSPNAEAAIALVKGLVGLIPGGSLITELGNVINPLEKRKLQWMKEMSVAVEELDVRFGLLPEVLSQNEYFVSFVLQASLVAIRNHQREKLSALRESIISTGHGDTASEDLAFQYLRYVDELSVTHMKMLSCLNTHRSVFSGLIAMEDILHLLQLKMNETLDRASFRAFLHDLDQRFLVRAIDLDELPEFASTKSYLLTEKSTPKGLQVTALGEGFLKFINAPRT